MMEVERQTRSHLMRLFERHGFHPRIQFGQNFLIDLNIIDFVAREADLSADDVVLEVGTGTGSLTTSLALHAGYVITVEIDRDMQLLAGEALQPFDNVTLLRQDALKNKNHFSPAVLDEIEQRLRAAPGRQLKLVANLPYSVATPIISNLVATDLPWSRMVTTIQYELGERMQAPPDSDQYGGLSVWLQSQCQVELLRKLPPSVFWPRPKVDSAVMRLLPNPEKRAAIHDRPFFHDYVRRVFNYRRKLLRGVLAGMYRPQLEKSQIDAILHEAGIAPGARAEELDVPQHVALANRLRSRLPATLLPSSPTEKRS